MKKLSIKSRELLTTGVLGIALFLSGLMLEVSKMSIYTAVVNSILLLASFGAEWVRKQDSEPYDEMTEMNLRIAGHKTLTLLKAMLVLGALILVISDSSFVFNGGRVMMTLGIIQIIYLVIFLQVDGKETFEGE